MRNCKLQFGSTHSIEIVLFVTFYMSYVCPSGEISVSFLLGRRQANLRFHFAGSGENLQDIAKSCDANMDNMEFSFLFSMRYWHKVQSIIIPHGARLKSHFSCKFSEQQDKITSKLFDILDYFSLNH